MSNALWECERCGEIVEQSKEHKCIDKSTKERMGIEKNMGTEKINHPPHYGGDTTYEAIKVIEAWNLDFCLGNAVKYICRAGKKNNELEDLQKAAWYLNRRIEQITSAFPDKNYIEELI